MPSSTSPSRDTLRRALPTFLATFALLWLAGTWLSRDAGALAYARPGANPADLPPGDWYVDYGLDGNSISYQVLLFGLGPSIENARAADLLLLGNSRVLFGFPETVLAEFAAEHGIRCFNLGFGFGESYVVPRYIIEHHDLRPRLVVVNADCFFDERVSDIGKTVLPTSRWDFLRKDIEAHGEYAYRVLLRRWLPHFTPRVPIPWNWGRPDVRFVMRNSRDGAWLPWNWLDLKLFCDRRVGRGVPWFWSNLFLPLPPATPAPPLPEARLRTARAFQAMLRERGCEMVITFLPGRLPLCPREHAAELARRLGVPFLAPNSPLLTTSDGSHLSPESGEWFARTLLAELEQTPEFRRLERR